MRNKRLALVFGLLLALLAPSVAYADPGSLGGGGIPTTPKP
ncbi:hypothetical protein [Deinococcus yavapaiensis]|uniref:Uncharacterized protein n=1 Tax=Deinococcus yavapaiensis KR-236 TaxID=694435 RepID=A0A318S4Z6_9DEIO|nr:hypothetical protein [Deinococcus yavapaiensis]PYE52060.1 hypothetical protein DES52_113106 [Deinococcus yavapaiensis KR-236]